MSSIAVIGGGYVGLTTAACFAHLGHDVVCADIDAERVAALSQGRGARSSRRVCPSWSPRAWPPRRLSFVVGRGHGRGERRVRVPLRADAAGRRRRGRPLVSSRTSRARSRRCCSPGAVVVNKSTVPVGSTEFVAARAHGGAARCPATVGVASNPEFLREGSAVRDFLEPRPHRHRLRGRRGRGPRVGAVPRRCSAPILVTDPASAEMIKYASNAFLATKISFINAIANLCEAVDADVREVALGMGYDPRIGFEFLHPGPGLRRLVLPEGHRRRCSTPPRPAGYDFELLRRCHRRQPRSSTSASSTKIARRRRRLARRARSWRVWGLTFKANTDDLRDSPALVIVAPARSKRARASAPTTRSRASAAASSCPASTSSPTRTRRATGADVLARAHRVGRVPLARLRAGREHACGAATIVDARNLLDPAAMRRRGFAYAGRRSLMPRAVVTGGAGFLGSHLCRRAARRGWEVVARRQPAHRPAATTSTTSRADAGLRVRRARRHRRRPRRGPVDAVLHFASPASPPDYLEHPIETLEVGLARHAQHARPRARADGARFLLASTSEVYGDPLVHPQPENYWGNVNPVGPRAVYDEAKRFAEAMTMAYHRTLRSRRRRSCASSTPTARGCGRATGGSSRTSSCRRSTASRSRSTATATQTRSFCYVDDEVRGLLALLDSDHDGPDEHRQPRRVHDARARRSSCSRSPARAPRSCSSRCPIDDPTQRRPDITLAEQVLGWEPEVDLREGLAAHVRLVPEGTWRRRV